MNEKQALVFANAAAMGIMMGLRHRYEWYTNARRALMHGSYEDIDESEEILLDAFLAFERRTSAGPEEQAELDKLTIDGFIDRINDWYGRDVVGYLHDIPKDTFDTLLRLGKGNALSGLIALVNSYESAMESALTNGPEVEPANLDGVPELNTLLESGRNPRDEDGLYNWDYLLATGNSFALELETGNLPMPEYDRRKQVVRGILSTIPERDWGSIDTRAAIEGRF